MRAFTEQVLRVATLALAAQAVHGAVVIPVTPPPDAVSTVVFGINDDNVIAGSYTDAGGIEHGFVGQLNGTYEVFDVGSSTGTEPRAIAHNDTVVGFATDPEYVIGRQFVRLFDGTVVPIMKDGVALDGVAQGVATRRMEGYISVGDYLDETLTFYSGYLATNGRYTRDFNLNIPNVLNTRPRAINGGGTIAGFVETLDAVRHGFIAKVGRVQIIDADDTGTTVLEGMNDNEFAAGQVADAEGNPHSFTFDNTTGEFRTIDIGDGSTFQQAWGVNNARLIAVSTSIGASYIYCSKRPNRCPAGGFEVPDGRSPIGSRASPLALRMAPGTPIRGAIQ